MKRRKNVSTIAVLVLVVLAARPVAAAWSSGESGAAELALPASALSAAIGGASAGLVEDAFAVVDNPSRIGVAASSGIAATHTSWPMGFRDSHAAGYMWAEGWGGVGLHARVMRATFQGLSENGDGSFGGEMAVFDYQTTQVGGAFAPDLDSFSEMLGAGLRGGLTVSLVQRDIAERMDRGVAAGGGLSVDIGNAVEFYGAVRNLGRMAEDALPAVIGLGIAGRKGPLLAAGDRLRGAVELSFSHEDGPGGAVGCEYGIDGYPVGISMRAGYSLAGVEHISKWPTGGLALNWEDLSVEFGMADMGELGAIQVISISYQRRKDASR